MTIPLAQFLMIWGIVALNVLTPGPNVVNTIATAMAAGRRAGLGAAFGVGLGVGCWCLGMGIGFGAVAQQLPAMQQGLTLVAATLMAWFSIRYLRSALAGWQGARRGLPPAPKQMGFGPAFFRSLALNWTNPKTMATWIAAMSIFPIARVGAYDLAVLSFGSAMTAGAMHSAYASIFSTAPAARFYLRQAWLLFAFAGLIFAGFAARLFFSAVAG